MSGLNVLVFEADHGFAASLTRAFQRRGCNVSVVDDGQAGLDSAHANHPDLIILSIELPRMNGFAVCNRLKKHPELKDVPLIIVSAESPQETFEQHSKLRTRAEDYIHKPISPEEIIRRASAFVAIPPVSPNSPYRTGDDLDSEIPMQLSDENGLPLQPPAGPPRAVDAELDGLTDAAFDHIMLDAPPESQPLSLDVSQEPHPFDGLEPPATDGAVASISEDFDDFTVVSSNVAEQLKSALASQPAPPPADPSRRSHPAVAAPERISAVPSRTPSSVTAAAVEEASRLRLRVEDLEREIVNARAAAEQSRGLANEHALVLAEVESEKARAAQAEDERARITRERDDARAEAAKHAEDRAQLRRDLEEARAKAAATPPAATPPPGKPQSTGVSTREFLELREGLHRKDKEILALKEHVNTRDKEILELGDKLLQGDRDKNELEERALARDQDVAALTEQVATLTADAAAIDQANNSLQTELGTANRALRTLQAEHEAAQSNAASEIASVRAELGASNDARDAHARQVGSLQADLSATQETHAAALSAHDARVRELTDAHASALTAAGAREQELRERAASDLAKTAEAHESRVSDLRAESARAVDDADARRARDVAAATAALAAAEAAHAMELAERDLLAGALEADRDAHAKALADERGAHAATRQAHGATQDELAAVGARGESLTRELADLRARLAVAERSLARQSAMAERTRRALRVALAFVEESARTEDASGGSASAE